MYAKPKTLALLRSRDRCTKLHICPITIEAYFLAQLAESISQGREETARRRMKEFAASFRFVVVVPFSGGPLPSWWAAGCQRCLATANLRYEAPRTPCHVMYFERAVSTCMRCSSVTERISVVVDKDCRRPLIKLNALLLVLRSIQKPS
jgi:hypothetical protein